MSYTTLGSVSWGSLPAIPFTFEYEQQRSGADMQYRVKVTIGTMRTDQSEFGYPIYLKVTAGGVQRLTTTMKSASPKKWSNEITYTSSWFTVENKTSGTTAVSFNVYSGSGSSRNTTYSYNMAVDPAASTVVASSGTLGTQLALSVTKYNKDFTHTITYKCGNTSGTVCTEESSATVYWNTTNGNTVALSNQNVTGTSVSVTFTIKTYSGSTLIGTETTAPIQMAIPASVKPAVAINVIDAMGYANTFGGYVQGQSKLKIDLSVTLAYGSAIQSKKVTADGKTYTTASTLTGTIASGENITVSASATDGRSRTGNASVTLTVLPYSAPNISYLAVHRCDQDGTENISGKFAKVTFAYTITALSNKNAKAAVLKYKKSTDSSYASVTLSAAYSVASGTYIFAADDGSSYDVVLEVKDTFTTSQHSTSVSTADVIMHYRADGTGIAFGKISEKANAYEFGKPIYDNFATLIGNGLAAYDGGGDSGIDPNTTLEGLCLTSHSHAPQGLGTFYYIHTVFYNTKSATAARAQLAMPYKKNGSLYHRYFEGGAWSSWARYMTADEIYPVGSVCIRYDTTNPGTLYGGTWRRIEGRFLFGCAETGTVGAPGTHTTGSGNSSLPYVNVAIWQRTA